MRRLWTVVLLVLLACGLCGDAATAGPPARRDTPAGAAVEALTGGGRFVVPADFEAVMGYWPVRSGSTWASPRGACSAPTGATRYDFSRACRAHDLGYDLLRYAARVGLPLGPWARAAIDAAFGRALVTRCASLGGAVGCGSVAAVYHGAVVANSWRQDWRDPRPEPALRWVLIAVGLTVAPVVVNVVIALVQRVGSGKSGRKGFS
ncbi:phospholipase A2 [Cryptosporangium phraense]|uniref:Phospholipase n=1 Tax=Cryptosporangium phraense TaxID=2593070 RepID=A0A545AQA7_9ACTN|nr:phospholipase A2 [Cryptosporangium phraense]TQS43509.1 hypothetical protein FL583_17870 [Cryptosporangium phraense]